MKNKLLLILLLAVLSSNSNVLFSQDYPVYKGRIIDHTTKESIIGAAIYSDSLKIGTVTNENGEFIIKFPKKTTVSIRHLSYQPVNFVLEKTDGNTIEMIPAVVNLQDVTVTTSKNYALQLVKNANNNAAEDSGKNIFSKGFYQKVAKFGKDNTVIHEFFFDAAWNSYGIKKWNITQARYAKKDTSAKLFEFTNISTLISYYLIGDISHLDIMPNSLNDIGKYYKFTISSFLNINTDEEIAIVNCKPIHKVKNKVFFNGNLYIKTNTYKLVKIQGSINDIIPFQFFSHFRNPDLNIDVVFKDEPAGIILDHANIIFSMDFWDSPFKKNRVTEDIKILLYNYGLKPISGLKDVYVKNDTKLLKTIQYDPEFWKNNEVVKRTPIEKNVIETFEKKKYFGNYFDKK